MCTRARTKVEQLKIGVCASCGGCVHLSFSVRTVYFFSCSSRQSVLCALVCVLVSTDAHSVLFLLSACLRVFMKRVLRARALLFSRVCSICRLHSACLFACILHRARESHAPCFAVAPSLLFFGSCCVCIRRYVLYSLFFFSYFLLWLLFEVTF